MKLKSRIILFILVIILSLQSFSFATEIDITAEAALLVEVSTGKIIYEKNSKKEMYPASTTKILTGILVIENCNLDDIVTVSETALSNIPSGYVTAHLQVGEELTVRDLLYTLMIPSANDSAYVLAEYVGGSIDGFSEMMNKKAKEIGCTNTHFVNPNGIHADNHITTAYDLYLIANYAMKNDTFRKIVSTTKYVLPTTNKYSNTDRIFSTTNELLNRNSKNYYYENTIGIKTGFTSQAGNCLVSASSKDGVEYIAVVLNSGQTASNLNGRYIDSKSLFEYGYENYKFSKFKEKNSIIDTIEIKNATKDTRNLNLVIDKDIAVYHNKEINLETIPSTITLQENIVAPIEAGTKLGSVSFNIDGLKYEAQLLAESNVEKDMTLYIILITSGIFLLLISNTIMKKNKRNKKRNYRK